MIGPIQLSRQLLATDMAWCARVCSTRISVHATNHQPSEFCLKSLVLKLWSPPPHGKVSVFAIVFHLRLPGAPEPARCLFLCRQRMFGKVSVWHNNHFFIRYDYEIISNLPQWDIPFCTKGWKSCGAIRKVIQMFGVAVPSQNVCPPATTPPIPSRVQNGPVSVCIHTTRACPPWTPRTTLLPYNYPNMNPTYLAPNWVRAGIFFSYDNDINQWQSIHHHDFVRQIRNFLFLTLIVKYDLKVHF